jgi:signal transduction histidine kinase/HAMP domain-containing protein
MLVMALIVTLVSISDMIGEINRQFEHSLDNGTVILSYTPSLINDETAKSPEPLLADAIAHSESLKKKIFDLAVAWRAVDEIAVTDPKGRILVSSFERPPGQIFVTRPDFRELVERDHWWVKWRVLFWTDNIYQLSETLRDAQTGKTELMVHVLLVPAYLRQNVELILRDHAWVAIFSVAFSVLAAFLFSTVAFRPLGQLAKMLDLVAVGDYEFQQVPPSSSDEFGAVASKVSLLGRQLKGAQSEFSDLKGNFERLLDEVEDAVLVFGRDRRLIAAAGAVEAFLSRSRVELVGLAVNEIFPVGTTLGLMLAQAIQLGRPTHNRSVAIPTGTDESGQIRIKRALLGVEFLGDQGGMLIRLRDPEASRQIGRQLQTADRLSAISRLTSGVAHEVKNPLNAILMHVELAKLKLAHGDHDLEQQMEVISSEILRLDRVVKTFLDFTRPVHLNLSDVALTAFVRELADLARPQAEANNIEVAVEDPADPITITVDPDLLKQAVLNIVVNAIEAMPAGGKLKFWSGARGDQAEIRISDTGPGIPSAVRDQIYNLYFTTKEKGSGIGLSMTFRIMQLHDGTIDLESDAATGTTFSLRLPMAVLPT